LFAARAGEPETEEESEKLELAGIFAIFRQQNKTKPLPEVHHSFTTFK
jgi:hypothetical protein